MYPGLRHEEPVGTRSYARWIRLAALGVFVVSFLLPAFMDRPLDKGPNPAGAAVVYGWEAFLEGLLAVVLSIAGLIDAAVNQPTLQHEPSYWLEFAALCWLANPILMTGFWGLRRKAKRTAIVLGVLGLALGLAVVGLVQQEIGPLLPGYFVWVCSIALFVVSAVAATGTRTANISMVLSERALHPAMPRTTAAQAENVQAADAPALVAEP